jgi:outer membrane biosynthesis protein TonB
MAKLKVFSAPQGFYETVVAAPSQKAALDAWGTRQNLFAEGMAKLETDAAVVKAALAHPGQVLSRPAGDKGAFKPSGSAAPLKAPKAPPKPKIKAPKPPKPPRPAKPPKLKSAPKPAPPPKPEPKIDRAALKAAEAALKAHDAGAKRELAELARQRNDLDARERAAAKRLENERKRLEKARDLAAEPR